jgi:hypothetical protein
MFFTLIALALSTVDDPPSNKSPYFVRSFVPGGCLEASVTTLIREFDDAELLADMDLLDARDEQVDTPAAEQLRETLPRLDEERDA